MLRIGTVLLLLLTVATAHAHQHYPDKNTYRVWIESTRYTQKYDNDLGKARAEGKTTKFGLSHQFTDEVFGEISYLESSLGSVKANGQLIEFDRSWIAKSIGLGYRYGRAVAVGRYYGVSLQFNSYRYNPGSNDGEIVFFSEKDTPRRYGKVGLSTPLSDTTKPKLSGQHVWKLATGIGVGFMWSIRYGEDTELFGSEFEFGELSGGLVLMYRH